jgi:hypothetical protein
LNSFTKAFDGSTPISDDAYWDGLPDHSWRAERARHEGRDPPSAGDVASGIRRRPASMAQDFICDPETGQIVAVIRNGEVFRDDREGEMIAAALGAYLYDLKGNLVGYLHEGQVIDVSTQSMPVAFRELLEGKS